MAINKKTGKVVRPHSLTRKSKAAVTRKHNLIAGITKPRKKKK
jgi:hypothetical protein